MLTGSSAGGLSDIALFYHELAQGRGITVGAASAVGSALLSGDLMRVMSDYEFERSVYALYPSALATEARPTSRIAGIGGWR